MSNSWFKKPKRRLYTWKSPNGKTKNQIDYILVPTRFRNSITKVKTYPKVDCASDHVSPKIDCRETKKDAETTEPNDT